MDALIILCTRKTKNAMRGIRSISGPRNTSNVWFMPRGRHAWRSAKYAFFSRSRSIGANNKNSRKVGTIITVIIPIILTIAVIK